MPTTIYNPVYEALCTGDASFTQGSGAIRYFDEEVSPFAGFDESCASGFDDLYGQLPVGRRILYASPKRISDFGAWELAVAVEGLQFIFQRNDIGQDAEAGILPLGPGHVPEMIALAALTKPGPFGPRTIEFGHYHGIFENGKLAAMTGQRLHLNDYSEVSAVCTHPDHLGKGYAAALVRQQVALILEQGKIPFLHVRADNDRAISLYQRLGFRESGNMNFYFLKK